MSNKNRKVAGIIFLIFIVVVGIILKVKNKDGAGWTLTLLGVLGLLAILVDWLHNKFKKPEQK